MNDFEPCGTLRPLTRPELDELTRLTEAANSKAQTAFMNTPLGSDMVVGRCAVAGDVLALLNACYVESFWRLWHGEPVITGG